MAVVVAVPWIARWLARRMVLSVLVLWGATTLTFIGLHMLPGNAAELIAGGLREPTPQQVAYVTREYGFNLPLADQYGRFLWSLMRGNLGMSYQLNEPVATVLGSQLWASAQLALGGMAIALVFALAVALSTAGRPRARAVSNSAELLFLSIPQFWVGILLLTAFSFRLHWFPVIGNAASGRLSCRGSPWPCRWPHTSRS